MFCAEIRSQEAKKYTSRQQHTFLSPRLSHCPDLTLLLTSGYDLDGRGTDQVFPVTFGDDLDGSTARQSQEGYNQSRIISTSTTTFKCHFSAYVRYCSIPRRWSVRLFLYHKGRSEQSWDNWTQEVSNDNSRRCATNGSFDCHLLPLVCHADCLSANSSILLFSKNGPLWFRSLLGCGKFQFIGSHVSSFQNYSLTKAPKVSYDIWLSLKKRFFEFGAVT